MLSSGGSSARNGNKNRTIIKLELSLCMCNADKFVHDCVQAGEDNLRRSMLRQKTKMKSMVGQLDPRTQYYWLCNNM